MRKAAGIMLIILGLFSWQVPTQVVNTIAWGRATSIEDFVRISSEIGTPLFPISLLLVVVIVGAGISALRKRARWWALSGAVCLIIGGIILGVFWPHFGDPAGMLAGVLVGMLFAIPGLLAVVFLEKRKAEFSDTATVANPLTGGKMIADEKVFSEKNNAQANQKKCPHCGQTLSASAFTCSRCKKWVPNEVFDRLCSEDVEVMKTKNLIPYTPSLLAFMVIGLMKDSDLEKEAKKALGQKLTGKQQFNLCVFESYCYFQAITLSVRTKQGCRDTIMSTLKDRLLSETIESAEWEISGTTEEESTSLLKAAGHQLYDRLDDIVEHFGGDTASQVRDTIALASAVYGDEQANIANGLPLYMTFMKLSTAMATSFGEMFLVEEEDFNWRAIVDKSPRGRYRI